jgi:hypothetical protein
VPPEPGSSCSNTRRRQGHGLHESLPFRLSCRLANCENDPVAFQMSRAWLGSTCANCGDVTRAREKLGELHALEAKRYVDSATFADIHASLGEIDEAVHWFQKAFDDRSPDMVYAKVVSRLNPRRAANAGYRAILEQTAFPP